MKLTNKQKIELQKLGYEPCNVRLNLYPEDFSGSYVWKEVLQCLQLDSSNGFTLAIVGIQEEENKQ